MKADETTVAIFKMVLIEMCLNIFVLVLVFVHTPAVTQRRTRSLFEPLVLSVVLHDLDVFYLVSLSGSS